MSTEKTVAERLQDINDNMTRVFEAGRKSVNGGGSAPVLTQEKTVEITENGTVEVLPNDGFALSKVTANVNVRIPDGYIKPSGTKTITENGTHDAKEYEAVEVIVPIPDGYIQPSGELEITENGSYDVTNKASVVVDVPSEDPVLQEKTVTENGEVTPDEGYDGLSKVIVNVPSSGDDSGLPSGCKRVDYIYFDGQQSVDTGIICNINTKIQLCFTREKSNQHYLYGVASDGNLASVTAFLGGSWRFGNKSATKSGSATHEKISYGAFVDKTTISVTGSTSSISGVSNFETIGTLLIGTCRSAAGVVGEPQFFGKIFTFVMWEGDNQVLKLVPIVDADGNYHFYDEVSKQLFDSITDTPLKGGNI
jgi:hypothetical protein